MITDDLITTIRETAHRRTKDRSVFGLVPDGSDYVTQDGRGVVYRDGMDWCATRDDAHAICTSLKDAAKFAKGGKI